MEETNTDGWGNLGEAERAEALKLYASWLALPPSLRMYYNAKGGYFMRRKLVSGLIALAVVFIGLAAYFFDQHPLVSIGLIVIGIGLGVLLVWEVESK